MFSEDGISLFEYKTEKSSFFKTVPPPDIIMVYEDLTTNIQNSGGTMQLTKYFKWCFAQTLRRNKKRKKISTP